MSFKIVNHVLAADMATSDTVTVAYPTGTKAGNYAGASGHQIAGNGAIYKAPVDFTLTFGAASITLTWKAALTVPAGATLAMQIEMQGENDGEPDLPAGSGIVLAPVCRIDLGSPVAADDDNIIDAATGVEVPDTAETVSYTPAANGTSPVDNGSIVGTKTINGVLCWELDVARNVTSLVTHGSAVVPMTIGLHGFDTDEKAMSETIAVAAGGTSQSDAGQKAFKFIRQVDLTALADASANTVNVGFGDKLGLPSFLPGTGYVLQELEDGAVPTAGTVVAGDTSTASATTGDVRGTYDPNTACDGVTGFALLAALPDPSSKGVPQYAE